MGVSLVDHGTPIPYSVRMNRRLRLAGALVALLALSAYFAEGVWASVCMPGMDDAAAEHAPDAHAGMNHGAPSSPDDAPAPDCPLGMTGMGSSCVAVSLPASVDAPAPPVESSSAALTSADDVHDSLLTAGHFRPPRA